MKNFIVSVECIIEYNGKLLMIKRPAGKHAEGLLSFPGGGVEGEIEVDHRDILRSAVKREVHEEVGLTLQDPLVYLTSSYFTDSKGNNIIHSIFYCKLIKTIPEITAHKDEVPEYYWMPKEEINQAQNTPEWIKRYIALIKE